MSAIGEDLPQITVAHRYTGPVTKFLRGRGRTLADTAAIDRRTDKEGAATACPSHRDGGTRARPEHSYQGT